MSITCLVKSFGNGRNNFNPERLWWAIARSGKIKKVILEENVNKDKIDLYRSGFEVLSANTETLKQISEPLLVVYDCSVPIEDSLNETIKEYEQNGPLLIGCYHLNAHILYKADKLCSNISRKDVEKCRASGYNISIGKVNETMDKYPYFGDNFKWLIYS